MHEEKRHTYYQWFDPSERPVAQDATRRDEWYVEERKHGSCRHATKKFWVDLPSDGSELASPRGVLTPTLGCPFSAQPWIPFVDTAKNCP